MPCDLQQYYRNINFSPKSFFNYIKKSSK